ncbi:MAG: prepilin-type N-terminal cleavage/methylation domain-containing protein [Acidimicrobiia bacterium]
MRRSHREDSGFTLIEVLLAVVIGTIVSGAAAVIMITALRGQAASSERLNTSRWASTLDVWFASDAQSATSDDPATNTGCSGGPSGSQVLAFHSSDAASNRVVEYRATDNGDGTWKLLRLTCTGAGVIDTVTVADGISTPLPPGQWATSNVVNGYRQIRLNVTVTDGEDSLALSVLGTPREPSTVAVSNTGPCTLVSPGLSFTSSDPASSVVVSRSPDGALAETVTFSFVTSGRCANPVLDVDGLLDQPVIGSPHPMGGDGVAWTATINASSTDRWPDQYCLFVFCVDVEYTATARIQDIDTNDYLTVGSVNFFTILPPCRVGTPLSYTKSGPGADVLVNGIGQLQEAVNFNVITTGECDAPRIAFTRSNGTTVGSAITMTRVGTHTSAGPNTWIAAAPPTSQWPSTGSPYTANATAVDSNAGNTVQLGSATITTAQAACSQRTPLTYTKSPASPPQVAVRASGSAAGQILAPTTITYSLSTDGSCNPPTIRVTDNPPLETLVAGGTISMTESPVGSGNWTATASSTSNAGLRLVPGSGPFRSEATTTDSVSGANVPLGSVTFDSIGVDPCSVSPQSPVVMTKDLPPVNVVQVREDGNAATQGNLRENVRFDLNTVGACSGTVTLRVYSSSQLRSSQLLSTAALGSSAPWSAAFAAGTDPGWGDGGSTRYVSITGLTDSATGSAVAVPTFTFTTNGSTPCAATLTKTPSGSVDVRNDGSDAGDLREQVDFVYTRTGDCQSSLPTLAFNAGSPVAMTSIGGGNWRLRYTATENPGWGVNTTVSVTASASIDAITLSSITPTLPSFTTVGSTPCTATLTMTKGLPALTAVQLLSSNGSLRESVAFRVDTAGSCSFSTPTLSITGAPTTYPLSGSPLQRSFAIGFDPNWGSIPGSHTASVTGITDSAVAVAVSITPVSFTTVSECTVSFTRTSPTGNVNVLATGELRTNVVFAYSRAGNCTAAAPQITVNGSPATVTGTGPWTVTFASGTNPGWGTAGTITATATGATDPVSAASVTPPPLSFTVVTSVPCTATLSMTSSNAPNNVVDVVNPPGNFFTRGQLNENVSFTYTKAGSCSTGSTQIVVDGDSYSGTAPSPGSWTRSFSSGFNPGWGSTVGAAITVTGSATTDTVTGLPVTPASIGFTLS